MMKQICVGFKLSVLCVLLAGELAGYAGKDTELILQKIRAANAVGGGIVRLERAGYDFHSTNATRLTLL